MLTTIIFLIGIILIITFIYGIYYSEKYGLESEKSIEVISKTLIYGSILGIIFGILIILKIMV